MNFRELIAGYILTTLNIAACLMMAGAVAHLAWYALSFGWGLVP